MLDTAKVFLAAFGGVTVPLWHIEQVLQIILTSLSILYVLIQISRLRKK